jgi:hypothetical protein
LKASHFLETRFTVGANSALLGTRLCKNSPLDLAAFNGAIQQLVETAFFTTQDSVVKVDCIIRSAEVTMHKRVTADQISSPNDGAATSLPQHQVTTHCTCSRHPVRCFPPGRRQRQSRVRQEECERTCSLHTAIGASILATFPAAPPVFSCLGVWG